MVARFTGVSHPSCSNARVYAGQGAGGSPCFACFASGWNADAVYEAGVREVLGIDVGEAETEAFWTEFLFSLKARGSTGVRPCVSDAHQGLQVAPRLRSRRSDIHSQRSSAVNCRNR